MRLDPNSPLDKAAMDHSSVKVKSRRPSEGKIVFSVINGELHMNVANSPIGFSPDRLKGFAEMVQVAREEGKLPNSGSVGIAQLEAM